MSNTRRPRPQNTLPKPQPQQDVPQPLSVSMDGPTMIRNYNALLDLVTENQSLKRYVAQLESAIEQLLNELNKAKEETVDE